MSLFSGMRLSQVALKSNFGSRESYFWIVLSPVGTMRKQDLESAGSSEPKPTSWGRSGDGMVVGGLLERCMVLLKNPMDGQWDGFRVRYLEMVLGL